MKTLLFGSLKGCLLSILSIILFFALIFMFFFDFLQIVNNNRTYFIDLNRIELYDEPIFTGYEAVLIKNLNNKNVEIAALKNYLSSILPPDIQKIRWRNLLSNRID